MSSLCEIEFSVCLLPSWLELKMTQRTALSSFHWSFPTMQSSKNPEFQLFGLSSSNIFLVDVSVNKLTMRLTSDGNSFLNAKNPWQKEPLLAGYFLLVKLMILLEDELSGPRAQIQTQSLAMLVLAGLLRFVTVRKIWREFCHRLASTLLPALGTRLAFKTIWERFWLAYLVACVQ